MPNVDVHPESSVERDSSSAHPAAWDRPIALLAATDGRPQSDSALLAARRLAPARPLGVVSVVPRALDDVASESAADLPDIAAQRGRVEWQLRRVLGADVVASVEVCAGDPPATLAAVAAEHGGPLLVVGIGRPKVSDRLLGDESALRVIRAAHTPVLAIAPGCALPAQRIVVAVDFSPTSFAAAQLAVRLAAPRAEMILVHVTRKASEPSWGSGAPGFRGDVDLALANWCDRLRRDFSGTISTAVLHGDPATELVAFAANQGADLVAVGAHGHGPPNRGDIGNITARLVRCASRSIVVAPRCEDPQPPVRARAVPGAA